jgi:hypothetical protein
MRFSGSSMRFSGQRTPPPLQPISESSEVGRAEEGMAFQAETRQSFRDVREDIAGLRKETEFGFDDLLGRVKYFEQKLGIESGK